MARGLDGRSREILVGEDGVARAGLVGAIGVPAPENGGHVSVFCPAFGQHKVVIAVELVEVRSFWVLAAGSITDDHCFTESLAREGVDFEYRDPLSSPYILSGTGVIDFPAIVKKERGVDPFMVDPLWM